MGKGVANITGKGGPCRATKKAARSAICWP